MKSGAASTRRRCSSKSACSATSSGSARHRTHRVRGRFHANQLRGNQGTMTIRHIVTTSAVLLALAVPAVAQDPDPDPDARQPRQHRAQAARERRRSRAGARRGGRKQRAAERRPRRRPRRRGGCRQLQVHHPADSALPPIGRSTRISCTTRRAGDREQPVQITPSGTRSRARPIRTKAARRRRDVLEGLQPVEARPRQGSARDVNELTKSSPRARG